MKAHFRIVTFLFVKQLLTSLKISKNLTKNRSVLEYTHLRLIICFTFLCIISFVVLTRVVTGIQFFKKGRIIHIFVSERKLEPYGKVTNSSENTWISDYNFVVEDSGVEEGKDYHALTWHNRILELDTVHAPKDELITGARFRVVNNRLRFEIRKCSISAIA